MLQGGMTSKALHEKGGATVSISFDQLGRMFYVMSYESLEAWGKFQDNPIPEFQQLMQDWRKDPAAKLVQVYTISPP